ncbi:uncharacterized protein LOC110453064 [Mizuhopecten yessoensis]|uniref:uncharacterized protein LOC110453064 n=1 Tax=Mizuhopecten yessoensis TaxID=6573 RepID=UPI000B45D527|nr:uncharacterized protein LOC110453064 [Mizuhopecten yessoensis]
MHLLSCLLILLPAVVSTSPFGCQQAVNCHLPSCFCSTFEHFMNRSDIPQMVYFGLDDAVTGSASGYYKTLFRRDRKNPNGCPITPTLYISHKYTQYDVVREYRELGYELAVHSVTHTNINTGPKVLQEARDQKENIINLAGAKREDVVGWRSPFLQTAGDVQVEMLQRLGYEYDISLTNKRAHMRDSSPFPFTLDYGWQYNCQIRPCPTQSHKSFWEVPVNALRDFKDQYSCAYVDGCYNRPATEAQAYKYIMDNFLSHYNGNRAPLGFNMHYAWFMSPNNLRAMDRAIHDMMQYHGVYIINVKQMLDWMKYPTKISELSSFEPWGCGLTTPKPTTTTTTTTTTTQTTTTPRPTTTTTPKPTTTTPKPTTPKLTTTTTPPKPITTTTPTSITTTTTTRPKPPTTTRIQLPSTTKPRSPGPIPSDSCQQEVNCHLPDCYCAGTNIPGGLPVSDTPQMVFFTMDGAVNYQVYGKLSKLLPVNRKNPDNCPVSATFFVSQSGTFRMYLKLLKDRGMEIASKGYNGVHYNDQHVLNDEMYTQLYDLSNLDIKPKGWRSPNLKPLGDGQFEKVMKYGYLYDSTLTAPREHTGDKIWPFTLDYGWKESCVIPDCPKSAYPGLWEVPNTPIIDYRNQYICNYVDGCMFSPPTANDTFNFLWNNFKSHYQTNKAPFGIHLRHIWFSHPFFTKNLEGLRMFVDKLSTMNDVYILSIQNIIEWMKKPTSLQNLHVSSPWNC